MSMLIPRPSRFHGRAATRDAETLAGLVDPAMDRRVRQVLHRLHASGRRLATAESCTGGLLASLFTDIPGVGGVFDRGLVTYTEEAKQDLLGVPADLLAAHGAVSRAVAVAMAEGLVAMEGVDVGVAVTGFADVGPEPGLVHLALAQAGGTTVHRERRFGSAGRGIVRLRTAHAALQLLEEL